MDTRALVDLLNDVAGAVRAELDGLDDWGPAGTRPGQYRSDLRADAVCVDLLTSSGLGVLSEESGLHDRDADVVVVVDPVDGSTNAARGIPWYATSFCAVDAQGALAAVVVNQASGVAFEARRGEGAWCEGRPIGPSGCTDLGDALVLMSGYPAQRFGWGQFRALGAAALDLAAVASGTADGFVDCVPNGHAPWDYLGAYLLCVEAGAPMTDLAGRDLVVLDPAARRTPVAAATATLHDRLMESRKRFV